MHECVFCPEKFSRLEGLVNHLLSAHQEGRIMVGRFLRDFHVVPYYYQWQKVYCLCGESFQQRAVSKPLSDWTPLLHDGEEFFTHLKRAGGLARHLQALRDEALLRRVALDNHDGLG